MARIRGGSFFIIGAAVFLWLCNLSFAASSFPQQFERRNRLVAFNPPPTRSTAHSAMRLSLRLDIEADPQSLKITNNGIDITDSFNVLECTHAPCTIHGILKTDAGMHAGWNNLRAKVNTASAGAGLARLRFFSKRHNLQDPTNPLGPPPYFVHVAFSSTDGIEVDYTPENGTGKYFYPGVHTCDVSGQVFTIVNLDRSTLGWKATECFGPNDNTALQAYLRTLTESDLLLASTWPNAPLGALNLNSIGGTDFTQSGAPSAYSYSIVGYGKGTVGVATESYNTSASADWHGLDGQLINVGGSDDNVSVYAFRPTDPVSFAVLTGGTASVTVGNVSTFPTGSGTPPGQTIPTGFSSVTYSSGTTNNGGVWLLVLDRYTLAKVSSTTFPANDGPEDRAEQSMKISNALKSLDSSKLFFLTTLDGGIPTNPSGVGYDGIMAVLQLAGVSPYAFDRIADPLLIVPNRHFAMVGVPNGFNPLGIGEVCSVGVNNSTTICGSNPDQWFSSIADTKQGETGQLRGNLIRNRAFQYSPKSVAPFDPTSLGPNPTADDLLADGLSLALGAAPHVSWPLQDTPGHINAYKYLSAELIKQDLYGGADCEAEPASACQDYRFWYTDDTARQLATGTDPTTLLYPGDTVGSAYNFNSDDWSTATTQLALEKAYLGDAEQYQTRLASINEQANQNIGAELQAAATQVANDLNQATGVPLPTVNVSPLALTTDSLDTVGSFLGAASPICAPCGVVGGIMNGIGGILAIAKDAQKGPKPVPDPYVNQLGNLLAQEDGAASAAATNYNNDLASSTAIFFDGVYSDWFKLQTVALMAVNPSAVGWNYKDESDNGIQSAVGPRVLGTMRRQFYLQTASQFFQNHLLFFVPDYVSDEDAQNRDGVSNMKSYSWGKRYSLGDENGNSFTYNFIVLNNNTTTSWTDTFGNLLMGPATTTDGTGNLNLNQDVLYDSGLFPLVKAQSY